MTVHLIDLRCDVLRCFTPFYFICYVELSDCPFLEFE